MSTKLVKYWVLEHQLKPDDELSQDEYDDSDWLKVYKAEDVERRDEEIKRVLRFYASEGAYQLDTVDVGACGIPVPGTAPIDSDRGAEAQRLLAQLGRKP